MIKTKIYGTIGPTSYQTDTLVKLIEKGMLGIRINLSHGNLPTYKKWIRNIKKAEEITGSRIPILADVQGPEIRTNSLKGKENNNILLQEGKDIILTTDIGTGSKDLLYINWPADQSQFRLEENLMPDQIILIDDGLIKLRVKAIENRKINCKILRGGLLGERKGVNIPDIKIPLPSITARDRKDIELGIKLGIDFIMLPFTRKIDDVKLLREFLNSKNGKEIGILAKIENQEGIDNLESFIKDVEGIVIARGDLGVEIGITKVPVVQKEIIRLCNKYNKQSIVVTHMLQSMIESPLPTRAEISDIANAVLDGCNGVMLTGETAVGKHPVEAVKIMYQTVYQTEKWKQN
ncbi:MAG: pyruvate kinase [Halanaerobiales bacterium]